MLHLLRYKVKHKRDTMFFVGKPAQRASGCKSLEIQPPIALNPLFGENPLTFCRLDVFAAPFCCLTSFRAKRQQERCLEQLVGHSPAEQNN